MTHFSWLYAQDTTLIYFGDPMCSWCYGITPELDAVRKNNPDLEFKLVLGGLRPYGTEKMAELSGFLRHHWEEIQKRTGQKFSYKILKEDSFVYDTEPACRAVVTARHMNPEIDLEFFKAVQIAFYKEGKSTHDIDTYKAIARSFGLDEETFVKHFQSDDIKAATKMDFALSQQIGIRGFPSLVLKQGTDYSLLANGYLKAEKIERSIRKAMK